MNMQIEVTAKLSKSYIVTLATTVKFFSSHHHLMPHVRVVKLNLTNLVYAAHGRPYYSIRGYQ